MVAVENAKRVTGPTPEQIFRDYAPRIYHLARRLLNNPADAEDVTQDVLFKVLRKVHTFRGDAALSTWLHRVTVNAALAFRRREASQHRRVLRLQEQFSAAGAHRAPIRPWVPDVGARLQAEETRRLIEDAVARLPENYRDVFVLVDVEGVANGEAARLLGLSVGTVKSRLHRARLLMRAALAPYFEGVAA